MHAEDSKNKFSDTIQRQEIAAESSVWLQGKAHCIKTEIVTCWNKTGVFHEAESWGSVNMMIRDPNCLGTTCALVCYIQRKQWMNRGMFCVTDRVCLSVAAL